MDRLSYKDILDHRLRRRRAQSASLDGLIVHVRVFKLDAAMDECCVESAYWSFPDRRGHFPINGGATNLINFCSDLDIPSPVRDFGEAVV